ncbi:MAG: DNA polymerase III subunit delta' [Acetobacter sp.]|nr:DNA polymerase III subunit delta' [Acetobacter sp.]
MSHHVVEPLEPRLASLSLTGHESAVAMFRKAFIEGRLPHAWLITGPQGIGKATCAFFLARILLKGEKEESPAGRRISAATHADFLVVERGYDEKRQRYRSEIVVDDIRTVNTFLHRTSAEGGWRVVLIDGAEWMNRSAANALLKILEEPPPAAILLLTSSAPGRLLPTIRSRCRKLELKPLEADAIKEIMLRQCPTLSFDILNRVLSSARGAPGRAFSLLADKNGAIARCVAQIQEGCQAFREYEIVETILRHDYGFDLFFTLLCDDLQNMARQRALTGDNTCVNVVNAWDTIMRLRSESERFNLDKQETLFEALTCMSRL